MCVADNSCPSVRELVDLLLLFKFVARYIVGMLIDSRNALQIFVKKPEATRVLLAALRTRFLRQMRALESGHDGMR